MDNLVIKVRQSHKMSSVSYFLCSLQELHWFEIDLLLVRRSIQNHQGIGSFFVESFFFFFFLTTDSFYSLFLLESFPFFLGF